MSEKRGILTPEILSSVWKSMSNKEEISTYISQNEPAVNTLLTKMKDDAVDVMLKIRSKKSENMSIEEVVDRTASAFFAAGVVSTKLARDLVDQKEIPDISKYIKDYMTTVKPESEAATAVGDRRHQNQDNKQ